MAKRPRSNYWCLICECRPKGSGIMCVQCGKSYDRWTRGDDGTLWSAMEWAAKRARRFAKGRG